METGSHSSDTPLSDRGSLSYWENDATVIGAPSSVTPQQYPLGLTVRELAHALRGEMLGHFLLEQFIGGGGMGVVFRALDTTLDRIVAVKVVASQRLDNEDVQRRFLIEAQSTARLDHPNIARVHYIGRDRGLPYIVFEYIEGMNVREMVAQRGPLPVGEALSYVHQIAHALAHAWQRDVVHRDIKPSNIIVTPEGQAKLVDMGLARLKRLDDDEQDLTATGITLGTFDYISPEQARDPRLADTRSDIYSLGCTLFFMLAGQAPFANGTVVQKLLDHQGERPPDLRGFRSDIPDGVAALVRQMLAKAPGDRQQTPFDLVAQLEDLTQELGLQLPQGAAPIAWAPAPPQRARWRTHASWAVPAAVLLLTALAVDQFSRDDASAAPFPKLRLQSHAADAAPTSAEPTVEWNAATAKPDDTPALPAIAERPSVTEDSTMLSTPLPMDQPLDVGGSLLESWVDWPGRSPAKDDKAQDEPPLTITDGLGLFDEPQPPPSWNYSR